MQQFLRQRLGLSFAVFAGCLYVHSPALADTEAVVQAIIGKVLSNEDVSRAVIYSDGSLEGTFNGISFAGEWRLEGGKYCREIHRGLNASPACMDVSAIQDSDGRIIAVTFAGNGSQSRFDVAK